MRPKRHERNGQYENFNNAASLPETLLGIEDLKNIGWLTCGCHPLTTLRMTATRQGSALQLNTAHSEERFFNPIAGKSKKQVQKRVLCTTKPLTKWFCVKASISFHKILPAKSQRQCFLMSESYKRKAIWGLKKLFGYFSAEK